MKYLIQLALIFALCLIGDLISSVFPYPFPGSVISMLLLLILLATNVLKEERISDSSDFLIRNMTFFFIAPGLGIIRYLCVIGSVWWQLIVVNLISLIACFAASSWTVVLVKKLMGRRHV